MNIHFKTLKFQEGGAIPPQEGAPQEGGMQEGVTQEGAPEGEGGDPLMQIAQMAAQALQNQDCNAAMQACEAFMQLIQQAQGGGPAPQEEPVYRKGGILVRKIRY